MNNLTIYTSETIKEGIAVSPMATKKDMAMAILYMNDEAWEEQKELIKTEREETKSKPKEKSTAQLMAEDVFSKAFPGLFESVETFAQAVENIKNKGVTQ